MLQYKAISQDKSKIKKIVKKVTFLIYKYKHVFGAQITSSKMNENAFILILNLMVFSQKLNNHRILKRLAKALIRLCVCAGWSGAFLVAHTTLLEISCHGSIMFEPNHLGLLIINVKERDIQILEM